MGSIFAFIFSIGSMFGSQPRMVCTNSRKERKALLKGFREEIARDEAEGRVTKRG